MFDAEQLVRGLDLHGLHGLDFLPAQRSSVTAR
jgi:hypothetical protein